MSKILRYLACLFVLMFVGNALAAGYMCDSYKKYTSCNPGYYMTANSSSSTCNTTAQLGNACRPCSVMGSNYTCSGGTACPKLNTVTCSAGYYLPANATSCSACGGNNYYCPGGTFNISSSVQGRNTVSSGYYSTGGTSTTRTGQSQCGGNNYYCSGGVRNTVSSGYYSTGGTSTTRTGQSQCTGATYCSSGVQYSCPSGYTANTTAGKTAASACQISVAGGKYVGTANSATLSTCAAGTYKAAHTVNYGSTSSCSACTGRTKYSAAGASACSTVSSGYYTTGCNSSSNNCTGQSQCTGATYCSGGVQNSCPGSYTANTTAGKTAASSCQISCSGGTYVATANAACTSVGTGYYRAAHTVNYGSTSTRTACPSGYDDGAAASAASGCQISVAGGKYVGTANSATLSTCSAGTYKAAHTVNYGSTSSCSTCANWTYSSAGAASCTSCPALTSGWSKKDSTGTGWTSYTSCVQVSGTPTNCASGNLKQTATSSTAWGASTVNTALSANSKYYVNGPSCSACPAGSYCIGGTAAATKCAIGSYSTGTASACTVCGAGKTTASTGTTAASSCTSCTTISGLASWATPSWSANTVSNLCTVSTCQANYYKNGNACPTCSSGTNGDYTKSAAGTTSVNSCYLTTTPGNYVSTAKAGEVTCAAGGWCPGGSNIYYGTGTTTGGRTACSTLGTGYTNTSTGQSSNTSCYLPVAGGSVRVGTSGTTLDTCDAGTYKAAHNAYYGTSYSCSVCGNNQYSNAGAASCTACDTTDGYGNSGTSASSHAGVSSCKVTCDAGEYVSTAGGGCVSVGSGYYTTSSVTVDQDKTSSRIACSSLSGVSVTGGTYSSVSPYNAATTCRYTAPAPSVPTYCATKTSNTVSYTGSAWNASTYSVTAKAGSIVSNNGTASATCTQCEAGKYSSGGAATSCSTCANWTYSSAGAASCTSCPAETSGWTRGTGTGWTSYSSCYQTKAATSVSSYCSAGQLKQVAASASTWGTATISTAFQAKAGAYVNGQTCVQCSAGTYQGTNGSTATSCSVCSGNTYAASSGASSCSSCPASYTISGTTAADHDAKSDCKISCAAGTQVATIDAACTTPASSWYTSAHTVAAGSTSGTNVKACLTNYSTPSTTTKTDHDAATDCKISCDAGTRIVSANATSCTTPSGNWYVGDHSVSQGSISSVNSCLTNYTISGTAATNHDEVTDCKITCDGGAYISAANNTSCSPVGAGYWAAESVISQGSVGIRNECDDGLTTIGSGKGADEAGDCGRVLNVNGEKIYLRSEKKTTPSLNVSISGKTFYGNMSTTNGDSPLKIKSGPSTYNVYDDSRTKGQEEL